MARAEGEDWEWSGPEQTSYKPVASVGLVFTSFSPRLSVSLGTSRPSEFRARLFPEQKMGPGPHCRLMVLVPDLEVSVCSSLRVCMGSPDQSWFLMQGSLLLHPGSHPGTTSCSHLWHQLPGRPPLPSAELTFMQPPLPLARGLTPICLNERFL